VIRARVRSWSDEEGWGVLDAPAAPGGIFVHFSAIAGSGFRNLSAGEEVEVDVEGPRPFDQDGHRYRAVSLRRLP
jgi:cold shock protein